MQRIKGIAARRALNDKADPQKYYPATNKPDERCGVNLAAIRRRGVRCQTIETTSGFRDCAKNSGAGLAPTVDGALGQGVEPAMG
jgi:hypothetical protein